MLRADRSLETSGKIAD